MEIRKATIDDFDAILELKLDSKRESRKFTKKIIVDGMEDRYASYLKKDLSSEWRNIFVAVNRDKIVGMILGKIFRSMYILGHERTGYMSNFFIKKGYRSKGIGGNLYDALLGWFKSKGCVALSLEVYNENRKGINFYKKLGFKKHSVKMVKDI